MIKREIQDELMTCAREYPVVTIMGPRQAGKTTLAKAAFPNLPYVSLEQPVVRQQFNDDPLGFIHRYSNGAIFDEAQHVPELFSYLQTHVDENLTPGRFILTGSQNFGLSQHISQSLAGRTSVLELLPFSKNELEEGGFLKDELDETLWTGAYPPIHDRHLRPSNWFANYVSTYIERDVRQLTVVQDLDAFARFVRLSAGHAGQLINTSQLGTACGVSHKTIKHWLSILQASYIACLLPPYYNNFHKRIIRTPKLYFYDSGLLCYLLGIQEPAQLYAHPFRGAIFENWVFAEIAKLLRVKGLHGNVYFWRTHGCQEVDFIIEQGGKTIAVEVKSGMTVRPQMLKSLLNTLHDWPSKNNVPVLVYGGVESYDLNGTKILPWRQINKLFEIKAPCK